MSMISVFRRLLNRKPVEREMGIPELRLRLGLLDRIMREAQREGDARWEKLIPQQEKLNEMLVTAIEKERVTPKPAPVVIGLKPLRLFGIRKEAGNG